ncbi:MAG: ATP-binding protein [Bryobacteraceae bacterium]
MTGNVSRRTPFCAGSIEEKDFRVAALVTAFNREADRVAMHAVRRTLVEAQAGRIGLPLWRVELPSPCSNAEYEERMGAVWRRAVDAGISAVAFGDLFLADVRAYRERQLAGTGLVPLFPLWEIPTGQLALDMIAAGIKAKITCIDPAKLDKSYAGREFDREFLERLPTNIDPCGENGEFHTFVYDAPFFSHPIDVQLGSIVERDGFVFADIVGDRPPLSLSHNP